MKALRKVAVGQDLQLVEVPAPRPGPGEVLLRVHATGICGTDLHIQDDEYTVAPPVTIGHETAGVVVALGAGVTGHAVGERATAKTTISTCGRCRHCREGWTNLCAERRFLGGHVDGGFASYLTLPADNILPLPDNVSFEAAALTEPLACCVHAVYEVARPNPGDLVVVSGPGPIGLLCAQAARAAGADVIVLGTSRDAGRFAIARTLDFEHLVDVQEEDPLEAVQRLGGEREVELAIECAGAGPSLDQCFKLVRRAGTILQVGVYGKPVTANIDLMWIKEQRLVGSFSSTPTSWQLSVDLMASGQVRTEPLATSTRPLSEWREAFVAARQKAEGKILLIPDEE